MTDEIVEKEHHLYGGSTAKYWVNCYGWASLVSSLPPDKPGDAADRGTALHKGILEVKTAAEIEYRLKGTPISLNYDAISKWPDDGPQMAEEFWQDIWNKALEEFITNKQVLIERKLMLYPELDSGGTADLGILYYNDKGKLVGIIGDLKTGYRRVEPSEEQLLFYLAALYLRVQEKGKEIEEFRAFVWQPTHVEKYTEHKFTKKQVLSAVDRYRKAILESKKDKPKFKVGTYCQMCRAQAVCKAYSKHLEKQLDVVTVQDKLSEIEHLSDETLRNIYLYSDRIEAYISAVRKWIISRFAQGNPVPGLKLVAGVSKRRWKDEILAQETLKGLGINPMTEKLMGITAVESMLKNTGMNKEGIAEVMVQITVKPPPPAKITTEDDARPALDISQGCLLSEDSE